METWHVLNVKGHNLGSGTRRLWGISMLHLHCYKVDCKKRKEKEKLRPVLLDNVYEHLETQLVKFSLLTNH